MQIHADPDTAKTLPSLKVEFLHEKYAVCRMVIDHKTLHRYKSYFERTVIRFVDIF
jgi:hypothetical protein